jgi:hypothetical protein
VRPGRFLFLSAKGVTVGLYARFQWKINKVDKPRMRLQRKLWQSLSYFVAKGVQSGDNFRSAPD